EPVDDPLVEVRAAEESVAIGGLHLEDAVAELKDRDIEGTATEVEDRDGVLFALLIQAVSQGGRRGLVDDALDLKARDPTRVFRRLALGIVEVSGYRDDRFGDGLAEVVLGGLLH